MNTIFIEPLAKDSRIWEIIGTRNLIFDESLSNLVAEIYCCSPPTYFQQRKKRKFKNFYAPVGSLKYLTAGSIWSRGFRLDLGISAYHVGDILAQHCKLILSKHTMSPEKLLKYLSKSENPHLTFLDSINYLQYKHSQRTLYIPCSEVIRHYFSPSQRFLTRLLTGKFNQITSLCTLNSMGLKPSPSEKRAFDLILTCNTGLAAAARHPYKSIKLTHIRNIQKRENHPFLLSARLPFPSAVAIWTRGARPAHSPTELAFVVTNLESEPQHKRARSFRERCPQSRDLGPNSIFRSSLDGSSF